MRRRQLILKSMENPNPRHRFSITNTISAMSILVLFYVDFFPVGLCNDFK
jgi:hypothetical protein